MPALNGITEAMARLLQLMGYETREACSGSRALKLVDAFAPQLITLDIQLGDMTGFQVARAIRARRDVFQPYLIAVTGCDEADLLPESIAAGIDRLLRKPFDAGMMHRMLGAVQDPASITS